MDFELNAELGLKSFVYVAESGLRAGADPQAVVSLTDW